MPFCFYRPVCRRHNISGPSSANSIVPTEECHHLLPLSKGRPARQNLKTCFCHASLNVGGVSTQKKTFWSPFGLEFQSTRSPVGFVLGETLCDPCGRGGPSTGGSPVGLVRRAESRVLAFVFFLIFTATHAPSEAVPQDAQKPGNVILVSVNGVGSNGVGSNRGNVLQKFQS